MFRTVLEMQPRDAAAGSGGVGMTKEDKVKAMLDDILEKLPDEFNMAEIMSKVRVCRDHVLVQGDQGMAEIMCKVRVCRDCVILQGLDVKSLILSNIV